LKCRGPPLDALCLISYAYMVLVRNAASERVSRLAVGTHGQREVRILRAGRIERGHLRRRITSSGAASMTEAWARSSLPAGPAWTRPIALPLLSRWRISGAETIPALLVTAEERRVGLRRREAGRRSYSVRGDRPARRESDSLRQGSLGRSVFRITHTADVPARAPRGVVRRATLCGFVGHW